MVLTKHTVFKDVFLVRGQVTGKQWDLLQPKDGEGGEGGQEIMADVENDQQKGDEHDDDDE